MHSRWPRSAPAEGFATYVLECPRCTGRLEVIAFIAEAGVARRILDHLGLAARAPPLAPARAPGDTDLADDPGPNCEAGDTTYEE